MRMRGVLLFAYVEGAMYRLSVLISVLCSEQYSLVLQKYIKYMLSHNEVVSCS